MSGEAPRVLLVRFSAIGDCVMAAWAATAIREKYRKADLTWAVETRCSDVVDRSRLVTAVAEFPRDAWKRHRWSPGTWAAQIAAHTALRRRRFDVGFDLQGHSKTALCLRLANPAHRFSARATDALAAKLTPPVGIRPEGVHTVEWNHEVLRHWEELALPERPLMPVPLPIGGPREKPLATISVSAGQPEKAYPADHWALVASRLLGDGFDVAFLGGPTDSPIDVRGCRDLVGKIRLAESMYYVAQSAVHLAADTGTGHMAAALGVPVVSVFGPTDPSEFRPYTSRGIVLREGGDPGNVAPASVLDAVRRLVGDTVPH